MDARRASDGSVSLPQMLRRGLAVLLVDALALLILA